jgi:hypothetical protein
MEIAALVSFGALLIAWLMAPDGRTPAPTAAVAEQEPVAAIA